MSKFNIITEEHFEPLARCLGECASGSDITRILHAQKLSDESGESTKWRRLYAIFISSQKQTNSSNQIYSFIKALLSPPRFVGRSDEFELHRQNLNVTLSFLGLEYGKDGEFRKCNIASTLDDAEKRLKTIQSKFKGRRIHPEVLKYCKIELMQDNYFHAVFEASKGLAQRIRELTQVDGDGYKLVDKVFSIDSPLLAFNTLRTDTEISEHKGFAQLLKGCFSAVRNPIAHEPKILWDGEDDAADYFSLISLLHRKLDDCILISNPK